MADTIKSLETQKDGAVSSINDGEKLADCISDKAYDGGSI